MRKIALSLATAATFATLASAESTWSLIYKNVDLSKVGLEKNTATYGIDFSYDRDIGEPQGFYLYGDFQLLFGKSDVENGTNSITYAEYSAGLGPMYRFNERFSLYVMPRVGFVGYSDSWDGKNGSDGLLVEGAVGVNVDFGRARLTLFGTTGKRWINSFDYSSNSYGLKIGWRF